MYLDLKVDTFRITLKGFLLAIKVKAISQMKESM